MLFCLNSNYWIKYVSSLAFKYYIALQAYHQRNIYRNLIKICDVWQACEDMFEGGILATCVIKSSSAGFLIPMKLLNNKYISCKRPCQVMSRYVKLCQVMSCAYLFLLVFRFFLFLDIRSFFTRSAPVGIPLYPIRRDIFIIIQTWHQSMTWHSWVMLYYKQHWCWVWHFLWYSIALNFIVISIFESLNWIGLVEVNPVHPHMACWLIYVL